jgi:hypothetical protein
MPLASAGGHVLSIPQKKYTSKDIAVSNAEFDPIGRYISITIQSTSSKQKTRIVRQFEVDFSKRAV